MLSKLKVFLHKALRKSEKYTKIDMVYFMSSNFWLVFGRIIATGSGMVLTIAFANLLDPHDFGTYKYILALGGVAAAFTLSGLSSALMRAIAQNKKHVTQKVVQAAILWSLPASIFALGISAYYFYQGNSILGFGLLFIAITTPISNGVGLSKSIFVALGDFKTLTLSGLPRMLFPIVVILLTLLITKNIIWIVLAYFASNLLASVVLYLWAVKRLDLQKSSRDVAETIRFGKHMSVLGFFVILGTQIDQLLLFHFAGGAALAAYTLALTPVQEMQNLLNNFLTMLFPKLASKNQADAKKTVRPRIIQLFFASSIMIILYIAFVPYLFEFFFPKYLHSILLTQALSLIALFTFKGIIDVYITAHGAIEKRYKAVLASQAIRFILFCTLIPLFGLWGAIIATVLSEAISAAMWIYIYLSLRNTPKEIPAV